MSEDVGAAAYLPDTTYYNRTGAVEFMARLEREPLLMQGPMGSVLMADAGARDVPAAFWNLAEPQTVMRIHRLYEAAGAFAVTFADDTLTVLPSPGHADAFDFSVYPEGYALVLTFSDGGVSFAAERHIA